MNTSKILLRPKAERDLIEIWSYLVDQNKDERIANQYLKQLGKEIERLIEQPKSGKELDDILEGVRRIVFKNHLIFYTLTKNEIVIIRVLHGARDWENIL